MAASRHNNENYGPKTDEMAVFGPFFVYDSGNEGESGQGKENQRQLGRTAAETGRKDGWKRERGDERVGGEEEIKRETGIGKEGDEKRKEEVGVWKRGRKGRTTCSLQSETGRDNLLTVLLCYQQKGSRY